MIKKLIILGILLLVSVPAFGQHLDTAWVRIYDGPYTSGYDRAKAIAVDDSGNVHVTGFIDATKYGGGGDYATIKYDPKGISLWLNTYNGPGDYTDVATDIAVDDSGNVFVTGYSSSISMDYYTIGYDKDGGLLGYNRYDGPAGGSDQARAIAVDGSGNVYVTGYSDGGGGGTGYDFATIKYDLFLFRTWVRRYSSGTGYTWDEATAIAVDGSGNVYVTGFSGGYPNNNYTTIKYDASGTQLWVVGYNGPGYGEDKAYAIAVDGSGNVYVTGYSEGSGTERDYATIKYNSSGVQQWVRRYNGPGNGRDEATAIAVDSCSNVYVTGVSEGDYLTIKYDASGNLVCSALYNGPGNGYDRATDIVLEGCNNFFVTGYSGGTGTNYDYATIRYDSSCNQIWVRRYNGSGNSGDEANAIAFGFAKNRYGNIYVTGYSVVSWENYATIRYAQFKCGDANCDGKVSVSDVTWLINYLFQGGPPPCPIPQSGDVNCDGTISVADVTYLINYLFKGGPPPCDTNNDGVPDCYGQ